MVDRSRNGVLDVSCAVIVFINRRPAVRPSTHGRPAPGLLIIVANPLLMAWLSALDGHYKVVDALGRFGYALAGASGG